MRTILTAILSTAMILITGGAAFAQSGHFVVGGSNAPVCTDIGVQIECTGKVAGLGETFFEIRVDAEGLAIVECRNPGGNVAPGQDTEVDVTGTTGPIPTPRNGNFVFELVTDDPGPLNPTPTCPNNQWTPEIVDVEFDTANLTLFEDGVQVDQVTLIVGPE